MRNIRIKTVHNVCVCVLTRGCFACMWVHVRVHVCVCFQVSKFQALFIWPQECEWVWVHIYRWTLSCIITHIQRYEVNCSMNRVLWICRLACRALSGISVTSSIKVSEVGEWAFVEWCSMMWSRSVSVFSITGYVHRGAGHILSPKVELLRLGGLLGHDVCPLLCSLRQCPTISTSYPVWQHRWHTLGRVGLSSGQDVGEILLQQFPCWIWYGFSFRSF